MAESYLSLLLHNTITHTDTRLTASFSRTTWVSRHQKGSNHSGF